jgi:starch synthase
VHLSVEVAPLARTGGLGEVVTSLAAAQAAAGLHVAILMPFYRAIRDEVGDVEQVGEWFPLGIGGREEWCRLVRVPTARVQDALGLTDGAVAPMLFAIDAPHYFDRAGIYGEDKRDYGDNMRRFALFSAAAVQSLPRITPGPVLLHAHDWHTALAPAYLRTWYAASPYHQDVSAVMTVHNAGFQGYWSAGLMADVGLDASLFRWDRFEWHGQVNLLKGGLSFADAATTVSPNHADELRTEGGGFGLHGVFLGMRDRFVGILNGIDTARWNPSTDRRIAATYSGETVAGKQECRAALQDAVGLPRRDDVPIFVMTARMVRQKGLELILGTPGVFDLDAQWVFLGSGERRFEESLHWLAGRRPDRVAYLPEFSDVREHLLMAGGDVCLMPCEYEPCGLTQMRAQRYGTLPLVRRVGGLVDTVHDGVTGFVFDDFTSAAFAHAITRALATFQDRANWVRMMREAMSRDFGWARSEERYRALYRGVLASR